MKADLYNKEGRPDYEKLERLSGTLNILIGGRRIGKTYGFLRHWRETMWPAPFLFIRSTQSAIRNVFSERSSPFAPINRDLGADMQPEKVPGTDLIAIYDAEGRNAKGKPIIKGRPVAYTCSLAQVGDLRGFNLDDVREILYDEFIRHPGEIIKNYDHFDSMFSDILFTINNERQSRGQKPVRSWLLGNSDNLDNPILTGFRLITPIMQLKAEGGNYWFDKRRKIAVFLFTDAPIKESFKAGDLARLMEGSDYYDMAYENDFVNDDFYGVGIQAVGQYRPILTYGPYVIAGHKSRDRIYCYRGRADGVPAFTRSKISTNAMIDSYGRLYWQLLAGCMYFDTYATKLDILSAFRWK